MPYGTIFACISLGWAVYALYKTIRLNRENARLRERLREHMANLRQSMEVSAPEYPRIRTLAASQINTGTLTVDIDWDHLRDGNWVQVGFGRMALRDTTANAMRDDEAVQRYVAARDRSRELLLRFLSPAQRRQFEEDESFIALSRSWKPWMVRKGSIDLLDDNGDRIRSYCYLANEAEGLPLYDQMLARKLMVEHHEEQVLRDGVITYDRDAPSDSPDARLRFWNEQYQRVRELETQRVATGTAQRREFTQRDWNDFIQRINGPYEP